MRRAMIGGRRISLGEYRDLENARTAAARWNEWVVMGDCTDDDAVYWTCRPADAEILARAGYEIVG